MSKYNKLWACLILTLAWVAMKYYGVTLPGFDPIVVDMIMGVLVNFGVYQARNVGYND